MSSPLFEVVTVKSKSSQCNPSPEALALVLEVVSGLGHESRRVAPRRRPRRAARARESQRTSRCSCHPSRSSSSKVVLGLHGALDLTTLALRPALALGSATTAPRRGGRGGGPGRGTQSLVSNLGPVKNASHTTPLTRFRRHEPVLGARGLATEADARRTRTSSSAGSKGAWL